MQFAGSVSVSIAAGCRNTSSGETLI